MAHIYALTDQNGEVRYIGKANDPDKRLKSHMKDSVRRDTPLYRWIRKNGTPLMKVLSADVQDWQSEERRLIAEYRRIGARLLNVADGGDEPFCPNHVRAENGRRCAEARVKTREARILYEGKKLLGQMLNQGLISKSTRAKMREAAKRHPHIFSSWADV